MVSVMTESAGMRFLRGASSVKAASDSWRVDWLQLCPGKPRNKNKMVKEDKQHFWKEVLMRLENGGLFDIFNLIILVHANKGSRRRAISRHFAPASV